jgi:integrase
MDRRDAGITLRIVQIAAGTKRVTARSRRAVPLNPAVVALLRRHKTAQKQDKIPARDQWVDSGLVFTNEFGGPVEPRNLLRVIETAAEVAGAEGIGVHTLRHSAVVAWLDAGVHIKAVADLLGHSSIAITGDVYGHTSEDTARAAVSGLAPGSDVGPCSARAGAGRDDVSRDRRSLLGGIRPVLGGLFRLAGTD